MFDSTVRCAVADISDSKQFAIQRIAVMLHLIEISTPLLSRTRLVGAIAAGACMDEAKRCHHHSRRILLLFKVKIKQVLWMRASQIAREAVQLGLLSAQHVRA